MDGKEAEMELLLAFGAFLALDVLALRYGRDTRPRERANDW